MAMSMPGADTGGGDVYARGGYRRGRCLCQGRIQVGVMSMPGADTVGGDVYAKYESFSHREYI